MSKSFSKITKHITFIEWAKLEPYMFWALVAINLIPVFGVQHFLTGDGPAHLYNAHIINSLLFDENSVYHNFFVLRYELIPNIGGHALLALLSAIFNPFWAEKILYGLILITFPLAFRYTVRSISKTSSPFVLIVFLLAHNFILQIGFQSFYLGLILALFTIGYFNKLLNKETTRRYISWGILLFVTALFHLFAAAVTLIVCFILVADQAIKTNFRQLKKVLPIGIATLPTVIFGLSFVLGKDGGDWSAAFAGKWDSFFDLLRIVAFKKAELTATVIFFTLMIAGTVFALFRKGNRQVPLLVSAALMLVLYFILPDAMASGGYIGMRLLFCTLLLWALWLVVSLPSDKFSMALGFVIAFTVFFRIPFLHNHARVLSNDVAEMISAKNYMKNGETLVPLNYSHHWLHYNLGLYLGTEKDVVVLDNYEAVTNHFPVKWRKDVYIAGWLGNAFTSNRPKLEIRYFEWRTDIQVDHVLQWGHDSTMRDPATLFTDSALTSDFNKAYISPNGHVELYTKADSP